MKQSASYNLFEEKETRFKNYKEFSTIYENIQQQQQQQALKRVVQQDQQSFSPYSNNLTPSSFCSSLTSLSSHFNQLSLEASRLNKQNDYKKLFVGNLPASTKLCELLEFFKKYGPINEKLSVVKDQNYAFVHFYNEDDAKRALKEANDSLFKNRYIRVQFSTSQAHVKKSKTFDTISLLAETLEEEKVRARILQQQAYALQQQQKPIMRPITGGNRCLVLQQLQQQQQQYYQNQRFSNPSNASILLTNMVKSNTFASFQH